MRSPENGACVSTSPTAVKIFGERNTGTNALALFIRRNSASSTLPGTAREVVEALRPGATIARPPKEESDIDKIFAVVRPTWSWKHCRTAYAPAEIEDFLSCTVIILFRNPLSWCFRLWQKPYNTLTPVPKTFGEFIQMRWQTLDRERLGGAIVTPSELLNRKMESYLEFAFALQQMGGRVHALPFERFVCAPAHAWNGIRVGLHKPVVSPTVIAESTKEKGKTLVDYQNYYQNQLWKKEIPMSEMKLMKGMFDWSLYRALESMC